jgi:hypothetical protein
MFTLPEDITALPAADLETLVGQARQYAQDVITNTPDDVEALTEAKAAFSTVLGEKQRRETLETMRTELSAQITVEPTEEQEPAAEEAPAAITAGVIAVPRPGSPPRPPIFKSTIDVPGHECETSFAVMRTAPDVPGMAGGQELMTFSDAAMAINNRLRAYPPPSGTTGKAAKGKPARTAIDLRGQSYVRHGGVVFNRQFPTELTIHDGNDAAKVIQYAAKEKRLPGGSLLQSAKQQMALGRALTAAVGWCAPSEVIYELCDLSSLDGILDLPEIQASRGGFQLPAGGGPDFSVIWDGIGNAGDVILTEYDVETGSEKSCFLIPCPDFEDVRLDLAYVCLTGSLLQRRTYPEVVELFSQQAMKALAHKINAAIIERIALFSGAAVVIPPDPSGDDAASALLSAVDLAVQDIKYKERMSRNTTLEVVLPYWTLVQIRAAMARRYGIGRLDVTDQMIFDWFEIRSAMPRFVYDWQDAYTGLVTGPGGATPLTALPTTVDFLVYPAGTWTKISQDVVSLDTIYDSTLLKSNQYTAIFAEDGFNVIQTCPVSRLYTAQVDPSGVVGCCP